MLILRILIIITATAFAIAAVAFLVMTGYIFIKILPQAKKENYLLDHGYTCDKGYWCKGDRSLAGSWVYNMSYSRLVDYIQRAEEKENKK